MSEVGIVVSGRVDSGSVDASLALAGSFGLEVVSLNPGRPFSAGRARRRHGDSREDAVLYAKFLLLAKVANGVGLIRFYVNRFARCYAIIEYK